MRFLRSLPLMMALVMAPLSAAFSGPPADARPAVFLAHSLESLRHAVRAGGPPKDGIPSIDRPRFNSADAASLDGDDRVIGVYRNGEARAYPQRILVWHEIVNDRFGDEAVSITYCPLTGTALGFLRGDATFGVSGRLVNSNLIMYDRVTDSEWPQMLGVAIDGPLEGYGLKEFRVLWVTWSQWRARHPDTRVLSDQTGVIRNYRQDPYGSYNPLAGYYRPDTRTLFPVMNVDERLPPKTEVLGFRTAAGAAAISKEALEAEGVIDLDIGDSRYTVVHDAGLGTGHVFHNSERLDIDAEALRFGAVGVGGRDVEALTPVNAFEAMWFAWAAFYPDTVFYEGAP